VTLSRVQENSNFDTPTDRLSGSVGAHDKLTVTPSFFYQDRYRNNNEDYWPLYSNPQTIDSPTPTRRGAPIRTGSSCSIRSSEFGFRQFDLEHRLFSIARKKPAMTGPMYNLGFYHRVCFSTTSLTDPPRPRPRRPYPLLDGTGLHLPAGATNYRSPPPSITGSKTSRKRFRLQSNDPTAAFIWTTGVSSPTSPNLSGADSRSAS